MCLVLIYIYIYIYTVYSGGSYFVSQPRIQPISQSGAIATIAMTQTPSQYTTWLKFDDRCPLRRMKNNKKTFSQ